MKKLLWITLVVLLFALVATFLAYRERSTFQCSSCLSTRNEYRWRIGLWSELDPPLSPKRVVVVPSFTFATMIGTNHTHTWVFAQGSPYYFFGTKWGGCAIGSRGRHGEFGTLFERQAEFREFVFAKIVSGQITTNDIVQFVRLPPTRDLENTDATAQIALAQSKKLLDEFFEKP